MKPTNLKDLKIYIFLFLASFILFANTISHNYAWDDKIVIEKNIRVQKGIKAIPDLFVKHKSLFQYDKYGYRPITLTSFAVDYSISKGDPHFSHFMNVFYYSILSVLIFILLTSLFSGYHPLFSVFVTLVFIAHPLHVEVVANIKSRDELFGLLFSVISLIFFLRFLKENRPILIIGTAIGFLLAYLSKENAITLLGVYPLVFIINKRWFTRKTVLVYGGLAFILFVISYIFYKYSEISTVDVETSAGLGITEESGILGNSFLFVGSFWQKIANALNILILYLKNFLIPYPLIYYYGYNVVPVTTWSNPLVWISLFLHIGILVMGVRYIKKRPEILFGFLFYVISISVYTHIVRPLSDTMADRFLFTASLGLCICFVGVVGTIFKINWNSPNPETPKKSDNKAKVLQQKEKITKAAKKVPLKNNLSHTIGIFVRANRPPIFIFLAVVGIFSILSFSRNKVWKDDFTLVKHDLPYMENCARAHYYYASLLLKKILNDKGLANNPQKKKSLEDEMVKHYQRSMEISDYVYLSYIELGAYYCTQLNYNKGIEVMKKGVELFPDAPYLSFYLGQTYFLTNQNELAIPLLERSLKSSYKLAPNYYYLSLAYSRTNRFEDALKVIDTGMKNVEKEKIMLYDALGYIYFDHNDLDKSIENTFKLIEYGKPEGEIYGYVIARCYALGDTAKGNHYMQEARLKGIQFK